MFYTVCFDIVDDRIRYRAVKILKAYGTRVQKSVFECPNLTEEQFLKMKRQLEECIDHTQDTVRYYYICRHCIKHIEWSGIDQSLEYENYRVI